MSTAAVLALASPADAQLVQYDSAWPVSKTIIHEYDWQANPYSKVERWCHDTYYFYDTNHDGKMDKVSIELSAKGHARYKFQRYDDMNRRHKLELNLQDILVHPRSEESCSSECSHRYHSYDCKCQQCDKTFAQGLYKRLLKKCKESVVFKGKVHWSKMGKYGIGLSGPMFFVNGKPVPYMDVIEYKDPFEKWEKGQGFK